MHPSRAATSSSSSSASASAPSSASASFSSSSSASASASAPLRFAVGDECIANWQADLANHSGGRVGSSLWHNGLVRGTDERTGTYTILYTDGVSEHGVWPGLVRSEAELDGAVRKRLENGGVLVTYLDERARKTEPPRKSANIDFTITTGPKGRGCFAPGVYDNCSVCLGEGDGEELLLTATAATCTCTPRATACATCRRTRRSPGFASAAPRRRGATR